MFDPEVAQAINRADGGAFVGNDLADRAAAFYSPTGDLYGRTPPEVPAFALNLGASQGVHFDNDSVFTAHLKYSYRTKYFFRVYDNPATDVVPTLQQWDIDFNYVFPAKTVHIDFLVKNILDKASVLSRYTDNFGVGAVSDYYVPPRLFILRVGYSF